MFIFVELILFVILAPTGCRQMGQPSIGVIGTVRQALLLWRKYIWKQRHNSVGLTTKSGSLDYIHRSVFYQIKAHYLHANSLKLSFIYSTLYKSRIFKVYHLLNVQTVCVFPWFCPYEPKQGKFFISPPITLSSSLAQVRFTSLVAWV